MQKLILGPCFLCFSLGGREVLLKLLQLQPQRELELGRAGLGDLFRVAGVQSIGVVEEKKNNNKIYSVSLTT